MTSIVEFKFGQGDELKDKVTGFRGVVVARVDWLNGCKRYCLQPTKLKDDGSRQDEVNFDEEQLELVKAAKVAVPQVERPKPPGGPKTGEATATRRHDIGRR